MNNLIAGFNLPHVSKESKINRILDAALASREIEYFNSSQAREITPVYWKEDYFNLNKLSIFCDGTGEDKHKILELCNYQLLEEAYFIEKAGVGYMAKMVTLADTLEERMLYGLFCGDEVTHLAQISHFCQAENFQATNNLFLQLLGEVVETEDKSVMLFILQVVLEGWGLSHYRSLAKNCQDGELSQVLQSFLDDESRHHGTGVNLLEQVMVNSVSEKVMIETLALFLQMVQVGPQGVVTAIEQVKGYLSRQDKIRILEELDTENHSGTRLKVLRSLMRHPNTENLVAELEGMGCFQPLAAEKCV
ncbi:ferritin-like domain-containing protein [Calothrix sp. 336/3]|uniref:ferritin-like domain-containing protein n=1 Tax=Calothrix sp. 336/3 TaxID=1337936 RepID=UPI000557CBD6|nr:ferritin-like domain-containing protein [Calothrix sp. 336/3]AKG24701.1 hypothetical protein IJ00_17280 [Calothrix sp. 336/3]